MSVSQNDLQTSLFALLSLNLRLLVLKTRSDSTGCCGKQCPPRSFHQELRSKTSSWSHDKMPHVRWFLRKVHLVLSFQKVCEADGKGGRGGKSLISFGMAVQRWLLPTFSYLMYLMSKPQSGWVTGCVSRPDPRALLYVKASSKKHACCSRGSMRRFLMQLNAFRSLFHRFLQIPETRCCVGNGAFLMGRVVSILVNRKNEKAVVGKLKQWLLSPSLKRDQLGF